MARGQEHQQLVLKKPQNQINSKIVDGTEANLGKSEAEQKAEKAGEKTEKAEEKRMTQKENNPPPNPLNRPPFSSHLSPDALFYQSQQVTQFPPPHQ